MTFSCHAENSIVVLRFRKTFVDAWRELLLDDILTDIAVVLTVVRFVAVIPCVEYQ